MAHASANESEIESKLADAAFGCSPGSWPLPMATTPRQLWLRAVAAGGQGRYGAAYSDLALLRRGAPVGPLASLAHSTQGSFLRQLGWHTLARRWDGRALALAGSDPSDADARADALIGLAADALGVGRLAASATLLARADKALDGAQLPGSVADRLAVRRRWVAAELAMASGAGPMAVDHATEAVRLAKTVRHQVKSDVVLAAAWCSAGDTERASVVADGALNAAGRWNLIPLRWAVACLLIDIGSVTFPVQRLRQIRDICADQVRRAGGTWRTA
ncbi:hypothetical protein F0Q45_11530 [Mycobacterium simiae]|uniref:Uncharacterized protein n=2 Tax=Mycobacterium simiae TaxID=1784 RepID=A0A5B1BPV4_MYCSI|nr:hypothetical protein [Mycobacterium simiae]KAA1250102.1 hypothetical protein F0Q45_11530 [Mycobacterium simiae]